MTDYALGIAHDDTTGSVFAFVSADTFAAFYFVARNGSEQITESTSPFDHEAEPTTTDYVLSIDGRSGYAVRNDGELVYVFSTVKGRGDSIVRNAVTYGATHLDCFDGYLVGLYERNGFQTYKSESNWTPGGPAVVYMQVR